MRLCGARSHATCNPEEHIIFFKSIQVTGAINIFSGFNHTLYALEDLHSSMWMYIKSNGDFYSFIILEYMGAQEISDLSSFLHTLAFCTSVRPWIC
jgi:hypothetical protein